MNQTFDQWLEQTKNDAAQTEAGRMMLAKGYTIQFAGGNRYGARLRWHKTLPPPFAAYVWISDSKNGLATDNPERLLAALYSPDGKIWLDGEFSSLEGAIAWAEEVLEDAGRVLRTNAGERKIV